MLQAVPALAPLCPALREVRVDTGVCDSAVEVDRNAVQLQRHPDGGVAAAKFVGNFFK